MAEQFCLRWNNHQSTLISVFESLLESGTLIDCTLYAEGEILRAHKVVLSACSPCFEKMLCSTEDKNPVIFLKDVKFLELKAMLDYMYRGEVNISQDQLDSFLKTAEALQIKGLTDQGGGGGTTGGGGGGTSDVGEPPAKKGPGRKTGVSDVAPESPLVGNAPLREGSVSPGGTKRRRRVPRRPSTDETSADNSCDIPPVAVAAQPIPQQTSAPPQASSTPISADSARYVVKKQEPMEPPATSQHNMIQPKTEFIEETNEDIEDLTLDDDDDYTEMSKPGTSFGTLQGNTSQQDFSQWQMMGGDRTQTDEVFMAAQEAINNQSNTQDKEKDMASEVETNNDSKVEQILPEQIVALLSVIKEDPLDVEVPEEVELEVEVVETDEDDEDHERRSAADEEGGEEEEEVEVPELADHSDPEGSDPLWEPTEEDGVGRRRSKRVRNKKRKTLKDSSSEESDIDDPSFTKKAKKSSTDKDKTTESVPKIRVVAKDKLMNSVPASPATISPSNTSTPLSTNNSKDKSSTVTTNPSATKPGKEIVHPEFPFKVGDFVMATCEQTAYNPPIWRLKGNNMLQRFMHYVKNGELFYANVPAFTAWSPGSKYIYDAIKVRFVTQINRDTTIKLVTRNVHKVTSGMDVMENSVKVSQKLQGDFETYVQALVSQALDSNFLATLIKEDDQFFINGLNAIDEHVSWLRAKFVNALNWRKEFIIASDKLPSYKANVSGKKCICKARAEVVVTLGGDMYNYKTLEVFKDKLHTEALTFCNPCYEFFQILHKLCHFKHYIYAVCDDLVTTKEKEKGGKSTIILTELLAEDDFLNKMFADACHLWAYTEKLIVDLDKQNTSVKATK